ncbi:MAG: alpha/beta fold hydrolase [Planctomycetia bacterium]|nr:alpha/beta fold hydrolase [Planctomycetia bacterium]
MKRWLKWLVLVFLATELLLAGVFCCLEERFVYYPSKLDPSLPVEEQVLMHPAAQPFFFPSEDGRQLHGNLLQSGDFIDETTLPILFCHGNGGWIGVNREWIFFEPKKPAAEGKPKVPSRYAMFFFDYRAYGYSEGDRSELCEEKVYADARAARKFFAELCGKSEKEVILMGHSLGGGVAVELAQEGTPKLILFSTFDSVPSVAQHHCPVLPMAWLTRNQFHSAAKIRTLHVPLLQFHGTYDWTVPYDHGQRLFQNANEPKVWVELPRFGHQYGLGSFWLEILDDFLQKDFTEN